MIKSIALTLSFLGTQAAIQADPATPDTAETKEMMPKNLSINLTATATNDAVAGKGFGTRGLAALTNDQFAYNINEPKASAPSSAITSLFHGDNPSGEDISIYFAMTPAKVAAGDVVFVDLYARVEGGTFDVTRDDNISVEFYNGRKLIGKVSGAGIKEGNHSRAKLTITKSGYVTGFKVIGADSKSAEKNYFSLAEVRAGITPVDFLETSSAAVQNTIKLVSTKAVHMNSANFKVSALAIATNDTSAGKMAGAGGLEALTNDSFTYNSDKPLSAAPSSVTASLFQAANASGQSTTIDFSVSTTSLAVGDVLFIDLYGRKGTASEEAQDDKITVEFYNGTDLIGKSTGAGIGADRHTRVKLPIKVAGFVTDFRIIGAGAGKKHVFSLAEVRLGVAQISSLKYLRSDYNWDLSKRFPWQPALLKRSQITPAIQKKMEAFTQQFYVKDLNPGNPNGGGIPAAQLKSLVADIHKTFPNDPDKPGFRRRVTLGGKGLKAGETLAPLHIKAELWPIINRINNSYAHCNKDQAPAIRECYRRVAQSIIVSEYFPGEPMPGWLDNGYRWRGYASKFIYMAHTLPKKEKQLMLEAMTYIGEGVSLVIQNPSSNTDTQLNKLPHVFGYIAKMDNSPEKWQRILMCRRGLDRSVLSSGSITEDGGVIHHNGHHRDYASYSFSTLLQNQLKFANAGIVTADTKKVIQRYRAVVKSWGFNTLRGETPTVTQLRPSPIPESKRASGQGQGHTVKFAIEVARLSAKVYNKDLADDYEMAHIAASKVNGNINALPKAWHKYAKKKGFFSPLHGNRPFPVMGLSTQRRGNWVAMIRGANRHYRGGEVYSHANHPGAYCDRILQGALFIFSKGKDGRFPNSVDSGFRQEGYDPNMFPNVTAHMVSNPALAGRGIPDYFESPASQGGGTDLAGNGTWSWWPGGFRKSAFFFGNRITLVTTGIGNGEGDLRTCIFQQVNDKLADEPIMVNGNKIVDTYENTILAGQSTLLMDTNNTGYYIPAGNPAIKIKRGDQGYTYASGATYKKGLPALPPGAINRRPGLAANIDKFNPTVRPVSLAYFAHGKNIKDETVVFTALVQTDAAKLKAFRAAMQSDKKPYTLTKSNDFHLLHDHATDTYGLATFLANSKFDTPTVTSLNRAATMMWKSTGGTIRVSVAATDHANRTPFIFTVKGRWSVASKFKSQAKSTYKDGVTTVTVTYKSQSPVKILLKK